MNSGGRYSWINTAETENHCPLTVFVSVCSLELNGTMHITLMKYNSETINERSLKSFRHGV